MDPKVIIVFGLPRSGTSYVLEWVAKTYNLFSFSEPHLIWKHNHFCIEDDCQYTSEDIRSIRTKFFSITKGRPFVEKSPPNIVRAEIVLRTFPRAAFVIVDRAKEKIINSCLLRNDNKDQMSTLAWKKYFFANNHERIKKGLLPRLTAFQQVGFSSLPKFGLHSLSMWTLKQRGVLPFGPRITGFQKKYKQDPTAYYTDIYNIGEANKCYIEKHAQHSFRFDIDCFSAAESDLSVFCDNYLKG